MQIGKSMQIDSVLPQVASALLILAVLCDFPVSANLAVLLGLIGLLFARTVDRRSG